MKPNGCSLLSEHQRRGPCQPNTGRRRKPGKPGSLLRGSPVPGEACRAPLHLLGQQWAPGEARGSSPGVRDVLTPRGLDSHRGLLSLPAAFDTCSYAHS